MSNVKFANTYLVWNWASLFKYTHTVLFWDFEFWRLCRSRNVRNLIPQSCLSFPFWLNEFFVWLNPKLNLWEKKTKNYVGLANLFAKSDRIMLKCCKRANLKLKRSSPCLSNSIKSNSFYCFDVKYYSEYNRILRI